MARNEEKAQAMLNRFVTAKKDANREDKSQRPYLSTECNNVPDCEMYRNQIIKEISKKVSLIQNEGLDEHRVSAAKRHGLGLHESGDKMPPRARVCWFRPL